MKKIVLAPIRKKALIKLGIMLPVLLFLSYSSWYSLLIFVSIWSYCTYGALYGREEDIGNARPVRGKKIGDLSDGLMGCGSLSMRKWVHGF